MLNSCRTVVKLLTHRPESEGLKPTASTQREKMAKKVEFKLKIPLSRDSTVAECLTRDPKIEVLKPIADSG